MPKLADAVESDGVALLLAVAFTTAVPTLGVPPLYESVTGVALSVVLESCVALDSESLSVTVTALSLASTRLFWPTAMMAPLASMALTLTADVPAVPIVKATVLKATPSWLTTAFRVTLIAFGLLATIACVAWVVESGVPVPSKLANVEIVNETLDPLESETAIVQDRPPATVVQFGEPDESGMTTGDPPLGVNVAEFVAFEM